LNRIFITAGPTWAAIDEARVISNTATGETGLILARLLEKRGYKVDLLLGPLEFRVFEKKMKQALTRKSYDAVIHSAALCDYLPEKTHAGKIGSEKRNLTLKFKLAPKLINHIKKLQPKTRLIGFKLEPRANKEQLLTEGRKLLTKTGSELVVANSNNSGRYIAYIVEKNRYRGPFKSKNALAYGLADNL
jgi:phosphopantothenoylcysteine decarboxylase/phosphopantothenate--cysteine ligase